MSVCNARLSQQHFFELHSRHVCIKDHPVTVMSTGNGLALILFGDPAIEFARTKGASATRSLNRGSAPQQPTVPEVSIDADVKEFEIFLDHCEFVLYAPTCEKTVALQKHDYLVEGNRPDATHLLPKVKAKNWKTILSRYRFFVDDENIQLLHHNVHWTLWLRKIILDGTLPHYNEGENYITHVVCFPQSWLSWINNEWFMNNLQDWFMQDGAEDTFGIPSLASARGNESSDYTNGRYQFKLCNVPITAETKINEGKSEVDVSEVKLQSGYTDHRTGIRFPNEGLMYVILFDIPSKYKIAREQVSNLRECVLCGDERPHTDLGLVFGECGHYICHECCKEYQENLNQVKKCFYCRRPTSVKLDGADLHEASTQQLPQKRGADNISTTTDTSMKQIMQRLQQM